MFRRDDAAGVSRRAVLRSVGAALGAAGAAGTASALQAEPAGFVPERHGFGFRNWSSARQSFEAPPGPSSQTLRERIRTEWDARARDLLDLGVADAGSLLIDSIARQVRHAVTQRAGTNGHCYGMVLAATRYFEDPGQIPVDRRVASEIDHPTAPVEDPSAPVYEDIVDLQASQFLRFRTWLGRRAIYFPGRIDTAAVLRDLESVVDRFGAASVMLINDTRFAHQVLAYGFEEHGDGVTIPVYDPNRPAAAYRNAGRTLEFAREDGDLSMEQYGPYTGLLFNRYDRIERATGRETASPVDHLSTDRGAVRESLFPHLLVLADGEDLAVTVTDPSGRPVRRIGSDHADRGRGEYSRVRSRYGAAPGIYRVRVTGRRATTYDLEAVAAAPDAALVDESRSGSLSAGESRVYELTVPESGTGSLAREGDSRRRTALLGAAGAGVGAAAGALGYRSLRGRERGE